MKDILNKILSNEEVAKKAEYLKRQRKKVVLVNGFFDFVHNKWKVHYFSSRLYKTNGLRHE